MKREVSLNGIWELYYFEKAPEITDLSFFENKKLKKIKAEVPGNFELSLADAGVIDKELFRGMKTVENQKFEKYDWWYRTEFEKPQTKKNERVKLSFDAVDCFAEYYVNGTLVGKSDNAFIKQSFDVTDVLKKKNVLFVHIRSTMREVFSKEYNHFLADGYAYFQSYVRRPAHSFGWDIFGRAVSGGITRDAYLEILDEANIREFSYYLTHADKKCANICFQAIVDAPYEFFDGDVYINISGKCRDRKFNFKLDMQHMKAGRLETVVEDPYLWWPYGYGNADLYDVEYSLVCDGKVYDKKHMNVGLRTVRLVHTPTMLEKGHDFRFYVNDTPIMCRGTNWVPLDCYHSKDKAKYKKAVSLITDTHCNIIRIWGGGVYEQDELYDLCDKNGIMVWQDFMIACCFVSMDDETLANVKKEAESVIRTLRHHPSIILWSGDNEIDEFMCAHHKNPGMNKISRQLLPSVVFENDSGRPYLASSPYYDEKYSEEHFGEDIFPERHLWGMRDYYKADFYSQSKAHFVSETGYHGCPSVKSLKKIVDKDALWPIYNEQWSLHSSDQHGSMHRVKLMDDQIVQLFGRRAENIEEFSLASQISQAEAKKYFIERVRVKKPYTSGIIWWNILDGWPQMSDAVVDYFFDKKLAYYFIKRSQSPVCLMIDEMQDWNYTLVASNDTMSDVSGKYRVFDIDSGDVLANGKFDCAANDNSKVCLIPMMYTDKNFLAIEWEIDGVKYYNHYLCGMPPFNFEKYVESLEKFEKLAGK